MNINIRENVFEKIKNDNEEDLIAMINDSVITNDEIVLPGLGVMLEIFWNDLNDDEKLRIANIIKNNISKKNTN